MNAHRTSISVISKITSFMALAALCFFSGSTYVLADPRIQPRIYPDCITEYAKIGLPPVLRQAETFRLEGKIFDAERLRRHATTINVSPGSKAQLPALGDKTYLYVIDKNHKLVIVERFLDASGEGRLDSGVEFLASHEGLVRMLQSKSTEKIELIAAGEIVGRNGRILAAGNGAGTYPGGTENLNFAIEKLKAAGVKIDERTEIRDYSRNVYNDPHDFEGRATMMAIRALKTDPNFAQLATEARRVMTIMDKRFPVSDEFYLHAIKHTSNDEVKDLYYIASSLFEDWQKPQQNELYVLEQFYKRYGEAKVRRILRELELVPPPTP